MKRITAQAVEKSVIKDFSTLNHNPQRADQADYETAKAYDDKEIVLEIMKEFIPIFKQINRTNNTGAILQSLEPMAAKVMGTMLFKGSEKSKLDAATRILDRTMGKPIERQFSLHSDISKLTEEEVDREISKLVNKLQPDLKEKIFSEHGFDGQANFIESSPGQEPDLGGDEIGEVQTEQDSEEV